jgi:carboxyl-terminal processing protease
MIRKTVLIATGIAIGAGCATLGQQARALIGAPAQAASADTYKNLSLFGDVFDKVRADYVEKPDEQKLVENAINGMLTSLDPHSSYLDAKAFKDMRTQTEGKFGGLGIEVTQEDGLVKVVAPIDDTPASRAGIMSGDLIGAIDDETVQGMTLNQAVDKMRGAINTPVKLTIFRGKNKDKVEVKLVRAEIHIKSVRTRKQGDDIAYVRISQFNEETAEGLRNAMAKAQQDIPADKFKGYILDLRNNPGGLLDQSIQVVNSFIDKGEIVSTRGRNADETQRYNARGSGDLSKGKPVVVLINGGSASASEIVAGALQDHKRATLIGTRSFGKGSVQTIIPLGGSSAGALRLTTARYYTPSGRSIQAKGIEPDIEVQQAKIEALGPERGTHEADLRGALSNPDESEEGSEQVPAETQGVEAQPEKPVDSTAAKETKPEDEEAFTGSEKQQIARPSEDYQLARALDLLLGLSLLQKQAAN